MARMTGWLAACALLGSVAFGQTEKGLVGYWSFDEGTGQTVRDGSGLNHHGTIKGGAQWTPGRKGAALEFNGTDTVVEIATTDALNLSGDATFMVWIRTVSDDGRDRLILGDTTSLAVDRNLSIGLDKGVPFIGHGNDVDYDSISPSLKFDGTWKHLAIVFEKPRYYLYVDGVLFETGPQMIPITKTKGGGRSIGGWWAGYFKGAMDEMRLYNRALSEQELLACAGFAPTAAARVTVRPRYGAKELHVEALFTDLAATKAQADCRLTLHGQEQPVRTFSLPLAATRPDSRRAVAEGATPLEGIAGGTYRCDVTVRDADGQVLAAFEQDVLLPPLPAWLDATAGVTDAVLPPYTPIRVQEGKDLVLSVWGRDYTFGPAPFLAQAASGSVEMLSAPVRFAITLEGRRELWSPAPLRVTGRSDARVTFEQRFTAGDATLDVASALEYDGFLRAECRLTSAKPVRVHALMLEIPVRKDCAKYLYTWPTSYGMTGYSGAITGPVASPFRPIVWVGDDRRGLSWFCESEQDWSPDDLAKQIEAAPQGNRTVVRMHLIAKAVTLQPDRPLRYTFAFQATPLKPMGRDGWDERLAGCPWYGYDYDFLTGREFQGKPGLDRFQELGIKTLIACNWTTALAYPWPVEREKEFKALVAACHAKGIKVIPYLGYQISEKAPEFPFVRDDVVKIPMGTNPDKYPGMESQLVSTVCLRSVWQDALAWYVDRMMREYDIDGIYLDSTNMPFSCSNALHGCGAQRADGTPVPTYPIFAVRDTFRRLYAVVKAHKPDGIVDSHVFDCMNSGALAFSTIYWNGEQLAEKPFHPDGLPLDRFRTEFMGVNWGVPGDFLFYKLGDFRKCMALTLPHDVLVRSWQDEFPLTQAVWKLADDFGRKEARFLPYYENPRLVNGLPENWIASAYVHPKNGVLLIVSNLSRQEGSAALAPNREALGIALHDAAAVDGITREAAPIRNDALAVTLPSVGWKYLWIRPLR